MISDNLVMLQHKESDVIDVLTDKACTLLEGVSPRAVAPFFRLGDFELLACVDAYIAKHGGADILEIGAGTSYSQDADFASPWVSRLLAVKYQGEAAVVATDLASQLKGHHCHLVLRDDGYLLIGTLRADHIPDSSFDGKRLEPLDVQRYAISSDIPTKGKNYVRPFVDGEMERSLYGLTMRGTVDYADLESHFAKGSFDIVIARHFGDYLKLMDAAESVKRVLRPGGLWLVAGDFHPTYFLGKVLYEKS